MRLLDIGEFSSILFADGEGITSELLEVLRALTGVEDTALISSRISPDGVEWGWGMWW
jgi:hypothetical protein